MTKPFEPVGERPQWQIVYDRIVTMEIGDTISHQELQALLPDAPRASLGTALAKAVRQVEDNRKRTLANVRSVGYRMVEASEHEALARGRHKRAKRQLSSASRKLRSADRSRLTPDERKRFDALEDHLSQQQAMIRRLDARVERAETGLREVRRTQKQDGAEVVDRLDRLTRLLERHGIVDEPARVGLKAA